MNIRNINAAIEDYTALQETVLLLNELGVPQKLAGRRYIQSAVVLLVENRGLKLGMSKAVYNRLSREHGASTLGIMRSVRCAVDATWKRGNRQALREYFGGDDVYSPTNTEFIARLRDIVMLRILNLTESTDDSIA